MAPFKVTIQQVDTALIVQVSGDLDLASTELLEREFDGIISAKPPLVVLDLTEVPFITSLGMGALARLSTAIRRQGQVKIILPPGHVRDVMFRSRVIDLFTEASSVEAALAPKT